MLVRTRRALVAALACASLVAWNAAPASAAPTARPGGFTLVAVKHSLLATHTWYQQTYRGLPVLGGFYVTHTDAATGAVTHDDGRLAVGGNPATKAVVAQARAHAAAVARAGGTSVRERLVIVPGAHATLAWEVLARRQRRVAVLVDAATGAVVRVESLTKEANGSGTVFEPNAVVTLQNESLTDSNNANLAVFAPAYKTVTLTQLDASGNLIGAYADNVSKKAVKSATHTYNFNRSQVGFEQVMGYYHITRARSTSTRSATPTSQRIAELPHHRPHRRQLVLRPSTDRITYGTGGVDDAEDAEVIWHEYGHAIQDTRCRASAPRRSRRDRRGLRRLLGVHHVDRGRANTAVTPWACIADWDSVSYTTGTPHCLRRVDGPRCTRAASTARSTTTARSGRARCGTSGTPRARRRPTR